MVPLGALDDAIANLAEVFQAGKPKEDRTPEIVVEEFHDSHGSPRL